MALTANRKLLWKRLLSVGCISSRNCFPSWDTNIFSTFNYSELLQQMNSVTQRTDFRALGYKSKFTHPAQLVVFRHYYCAIIREIQCFQLILTFKMNFSFFWDVTQRMLLRTDVSGPPFRPIFKDQIYFWTDWPLKIGLVRNHETSVLNQSAVRNNQEDGRIQFNRGESVWSCI